MGLQGVVNELRLVVTATDYDDAVHFYRDVLGLRQTESYQSADGHVVILDAGSATIEINDPAYAAYVDDVEVGRRVAGHVRVAFGVDDSASTTRRLVNAGAHLVREPVRTPWGTLNSRLEAPAGLQLTLFSDLRAG